MACKVTTSAPSKPPTLDALHLANLERIERRLESCLRDLRQYRAEQQAATTEQGVLGSRGLTQFVIDLLRQAKMTYDEAWDRCMPGNIVVMPSMGMSIREILAAAESAGYAIPTARTLSKRLNMRSYRVGDIAWSRSGNDNDGPTATPNAGFWYWVDQQQADQP
jgi:hypothetical protein